ncbi:MAG: tetratricopeptide repeat protein [Anaerolineae bacterium]|nr:tetratricopeptide repeat protein [Anaerolineae bacterium]
MEISLQEYIQRVDGLIEKGQYEEAQAHLRHILQHYPKYLPAYRLFGQALLEMGQDDQAEEMFRRALSGDPEDLFARVGLSEIYNRRGDLSNALWQMERAFELAPENEVIQEELRQLYGRRDGLAPTRVQLTRGALARLYLRGGMYARAAEVLRTLVKEEPERMDLWVALAEALWRDGQRVHAEEACLRVLDELPFCLKANLLLGEIWARSGREEAMVHLRRVEALDPENRRAVALLGDLSPLPVKEVRIPYLEFVPPGMPGKPEPVPPRWAPAEEIALVDLERTADVQLEIPAWLEELGLGEVSAVEIEGEIPVPAWLMPEEEISGPREEVPHEIPEWLRETAPPQAPAPAEIPEWLREAAPPPAPTPERIEEKVGPSEAVERPTAAMPSWLTEGGLPEGEDVLAWLASLAAGKEAELRAAVEAEAEARLAEIMGRETAPPVPKTAPPEMPAPAEIPEWLREAAPPEMPAPAEIPEWLREAAPPQAPAPAEIPEWLREAAPPQAPAPAEIPERLRETAPPEAPAPAEIPEWLEELVPPEVPRVEVPPAEPSVFGWAAFGEEEGILPTPPEERLSEKPFGWTTFEEILAPEIPPSPPEAPGPSVEVSLMEPTPEVPAPPVIPPVEIPVPPPVVPEAQPKAPMPTAAPPEVPERVKPSLTLARELWQNGQHAASLDVYSGLLKRGEDLEEILTDIQARLAERPGDPVVLRILGDVYMRLGRLADALAAYREALERL